MALRSNWFFFFPDTKVRGLVSTFRKLQRDGIQGSAYRTGFQLEESTGSIG